MMILISSAETKAHPAAGYFSRLTAWEGGSGDTT